MAQQAVRRNTAASRPDPAPIFRLYGEDAASGLPDLVHVETLKDRSILHDWRIKPHRHADLCQFMLFLTPGVDVELDGRALRTTAPALLFVPPRVVHGFRFNPQVVGAVTTIPVETAQDAGSDLIAGAEPLLIGAEAPAFDRLGRLLGDIEDEYRAARPGRTQAIRALIALALLEVRRASGAGAGVDVDRGVAERRVTAFLRAVERRYAEGWDVAAYAREVGVSRPQLARDCRAVTGRSPLDVIHARIVKEANRKLAYTPWPIAQIAHALGFADVAYFSRFYRLRTGAAPSAYRASIRARARPLPSTGNGTTA